jgi:hypothetical protein
VSLYEDGRPCHAIFKGWARENTVWVIHSKGISKSLRELVLMKSNAWSRAGELVNKAIFGISCPCPKLN